MEQAHGRARDPHATSQASGRGLLSYGGGVDGIGVTTGQPRVYLIFWGSQWGTSSTGADGYVHLSGDPQGMAPRVQALFSGLGTNGETWSGVMTQYCQGVSVGATSCPNTAAHVAFPASPPLAGVWVDTAAAAPGSATEHQLGVEALNGVAHFGNTSAASNRNAQYVVVSPTGTHPDGFNTFTGQFCAWHDYNGDSTLTGGAISSPYGDFAFTNLPYVTDMGASCGANFVNGGAAGTLDGVTIVEGHEYAETISDQNPAGGWTDSAGYENADKCAWISGTGPEAARNVAFATGSFAMQTTFSDDTNSCLISHAIVTNTVSNDFSISTSPTSISTTQGAATAPVTVSTQVASGAAQAVTFSLTGLPAGVTGSFTPTSVTAGSSAQLTLSAAANATTGTFTLGVVGTGASATHTTSLQLTVTATNDFSIAMSPAAVSAVQGAAAQSTVQLGLTAGAAQNVTLAVSGAPAGVTPAFSANPVTSSGGTSTLTLSTSASTPTGTYTLTITGTGASATHTATLSLAITSSGGSGIVNGGFETGNLNGWTISGTASARTTPHSGTYSARVGSTSPTHTSSIAQTFTVPAGRSVLSFWYREVCGDTVLNDWATATLRDNTASTTATPLPHTCTNTGTWVQISAGVTAGHSYTLTLVNHDDNNWFNASTYTYYDDVVLS